MIWKSTNVKINSNNSWGDSKIEIYIYICINYHLFFRPGVFSQNLHLFKVEVDIGFNHGIHWFSLHTHLFGFFDKQIKTPTRPTKKGRGFPTQKGRCRTTSAPWSQNSQTIRLVWCQRQRKSDLNSTAVLSKGLSRPWWFDWTDPGKEYRKVSGWYEYLDAVREIPMSCETVVYSKDSKSSFSAVTFHYIY